jgi:RHS repeat-associated protein
MTHLIKLTSVFILTCLTGNGLLRAQPVAPTANAPVTEPAQPGFSVTYYGLENITGQTKFNYIRTQVPDQPIQSWPSGSFQYRQVTDYFDGLGRPLQSVSMKSQQDGHDIVKHHVYDSTGKEKYQYLPFAVPSSLMYFQNGNLKPDAKDKLRAFYDQAGPDEPPYSRTDDDASPMGRAVKTLAPGRSWVGLNRGVDIVYRVNNSIENIRMWTIGFGSTDLPVSNYIYVTGELSVTESTDEDGKRQFTYTDKSGKVIFTKSPIIASPGANHQDFACTYYVYDKMERLRFVIPPKAVALIDGTWDVSVVTELCFSYLYDNQGRLTEKKVPGKETEEYVYDKRDRLVFSRDGNLRAKGKVLFILYDALNRPIVTGLADASVSRLSLVNYVEDNTAYPSSDFLYYIKNYDLYQFYPPDNLAGCKLLSYTYYDNYSQLPGISYDYAQFTGNLPPTGRPELVAPPQTASTMTRGRVTGSKIAVLEPGTDVVSKWITTANFYDDHGRLIQTASNNMKDGKEIVSNLYYFQGMLWRAVVHHENPDALSVPGATDGPVTAFNLVKTFERNIGIAGGNDAVRKITQKINDGPVYDLVAYDYDHLGRNTTKSLNTGVVLNEYNMRGFLRHINAEDRTVYPFKPIFEEHLCYDTGFASKLYNGNIAGIIWNGSDAQKRSYGYTYDQLDRLNHAEFRLNNGTWNHTTKDYTVSNITYDLNGNILKMNQVGWDPVTNAVVGIDRLTYTYANASNRLIKVLDAGAASSLPDFKDGVNVTKEYDYDVNGNMVKDLNKKIPSITYNYLNKPAEIDVTNKGKIQYFYDASGIVLKKVISGDVTATYDYFGGFVYKDDVLQYIVNEEGRARPVANAGSNNETKFVYDYFVKDHLGNVRSTVAANPVTADYLARHEIATANIEQLVFDNIPSVRDGKPISTDPEDNKAAHLIAEDADQRIGTAIMLRVMPGDKFTINAEAFYDGEFHDNGTVSANDIVGSLTGALMGGSTYAGVPVSELPENIATVKRILENPALASQIAGLQVNNADPNAPKAHITHLFFDDQMQLVPDLSGSFQIPANNGGNWQAVDPGTVCNCTVAGPGTSGWVVIYVDNQSIGKDVWFDNIHIEHYTSEVLEENHYYPHGLTVKLDQSGQGDLPGQPYTFVGKDLEKTYGLEMNDFGARMFDPQLGIWHAPDPMADNSPYESPFVYAGNNPAGLVDKGGLYKISAENMRQYLQDYPMIMNYLATQVEHDISGSDKIINGLISTNPNIQPTTIKEISKWGQGPEIKFVPAPGEAESGVEDKYAGGFTRKDAHEIQLNSKYADYVEAVLSGTDNSESKEVVFMRFYMDLIHETGHELNKNGNALITMPNGNQGYVKKYNGRVKGELGDKAEENIWGTPTYKPFTIPDPNVKHGVKGLKPEKYQPGVTEDVINSAKQSEEGKKSLPTISTR